MVESKQVKVDNWGIFFLQRLQQFYNKTFFCDLTLQFEDNVQIKVHRLVMNACTEYFQMLEQTCEMQKDCLLMPSNLPSDVVIPIINFMYSGILEFHESLFDRLYSTARLMNMSVLTKLLDAQKTPIKPVMPIPKRVQSVTPITWNLQGKRISTKSFAEPDLPETLPGRKLPIWKRKSVPSSISFLGSNNYDTFSPTVVRTCHDETPKPTRFEWPDEDSSYENSFDDISYTSKPLSLPSLSPVQEKSPKPSTSSTFEEIKKTAIPVKRSASPLGNQCKKVNIQDVKEYLKEHKIRSDYIDYDDSEITDNDLQTYDNDDSNEEHSKDASDIFIQNNEDNPSKSILKNEPGTNHTNKHVRFTLDGKENTEKKGQPTAGKSVTKTSNVSTKTEQNAPDMSKHTKIITEVLKKYPHLVKNNKNIRLKILAKSNTPTNLKTIPTKINTTTKSIGKISYMVVKPDQNQKPQPAIDKEKTSTEPSSWECTRCEEPQGFTSYHTYRHHLTEAHNEKQDSQMCILCGHISRKQNMLVYHKYIKHNIPPPAMYNFPKCKECSHIALSPTLLQKHMASHSITNLTCNECKTMFPSKSELTSHLQQTGHTQDRVSPQWGCNFCDKRFFSENILNTHIKRSHENELKDQKTDIKQDIDEINTLKSKDKIKILSDVKVNKAIPNASLIPVRTIEETASVKTKAQNPEQIEHSSEAEALSNVASGIAASLGLVDTIVVLDENQFILQSAQHGDIQENILTSADSEYIIPEMEINQISTIATSSMNQISHPTVTLSSNTNTALTQSLHKTGITSTDELVMVLTDHDYSDGTNNAVITDNNIVVLYSHPVQTQATTMMITSDAGMIEVGKNYAVTSNIPVSIAEQTAHCEESIEMIQQEINNQLDANVLPSEQSIVMAQYVQNNDAGSSIQIKPGEVHCNEIENTFIVCSNEDEMTIDQAHEVKTPEILSEDVEMRINHPEKRIQEVLSENVDSNVHPEDKIPDVLSEDVEMKSNDHSEEKIQEVLTENVDMSMNDHSEHKIQEVLSENVELRLYVPKDKIQEDSSEHVNISSSANPEDNLQEELSDNAEMGMNHHPEEQIEDLSEDVNMSANNNPENKIQEVVSEENQNVELIEEFEKEIKKNPVESDNILKKLESMEASNELVETNMEMRSSNICNEEKLKESNVEISMPTEEAINSTNLEVTKDIEGLQQLKIDETDSTLPFNNTDIISEDNETMLIDEENTIIERDESFTNTEICCEPNSTQLPVHESNELIIKQSDSDTQEIQNMIQDGIENAKKEIEHDVDNMNMTQEIEYIQEESIESFKSYGDYVVESDTKSAESSLVTIDASLNNEDQPIQSGENISEKKVDEETDISKNNEETDISKPNEITDNSKEYVDETPTEEMSNNFINQPKDNMEEIPDPQNNLIVSKEMNIETNENVDSCLKDEDSKNKIKSENDLIENDNLNKETENKESTPLVLQNERISKLLDDWDDGDTDSQQSFSKSVPRDVENTGSSINKLIDDWDDEEDT